MNSYKRLVPGFEAPVYLAWSRRNRSALIRVPLYHPGKEQATRAELRCPDPACNPYLCRRDASRRPRGGRKGYELPEPMEQNLYHLTPEERAQRGIEELPETLGEAIEIAAESELVLRVLGEHTFKRFIEVKREEWEEYRVRCHPGGRALPADPSAPVQSEAFAGRLARPQVSAALAQLADRLGRGRARVDRAEQQLLADRAGRRHRPQLAAQLGRRWCRRGSGGSCPRAR